LQKTAARDLAHHWLSPEKMWLGEWDGLTLSYSRRQNVYTKTGPFPGKKGERGASAPW
jgi:hypothetical protein